MSPLFIALGMSAAAPMSLDNQLNVDSSFEITVRLEIGWYDLTLCTVRILEQRRDTGLPGPHMDDSDWLNRTINKIVRTGRYNGFNGHCMSNSKWPARASTAAWCMKSEERCARYTCQSVFKEPSMPPGDGARPWHRCSLMNLMGPLALRVHLQSPERLTLPAHKIR